jgi:hypothetical protein
MVCELLIQRRRGGRQRYRRVAVVVKVPRAWRMPVMAIRNSSAAQVSSR